MIDNNTTEKKYISQVVLPPIEQGGNERLYLIKDKNARDNIETLQSNLTSLNEEINTLDTKVDNLDIPDISNLVTTDNLNNKISNLITKNELDNTYVRWSALASNYSNNSVLNNNYAHTTNGIIDNATVDYTDVNNLYNNYAHTNTNGTIDNALIDYTSINNLYNNYAHINNGEIDNATIDHSNINNLNTNYAHINNGTIDNANIDYANVNNLENNYAHINNGIIDNATINYTDINNLNANYAHINNGKIDNATIDQSKINNLKSNYAHITNGAIDNATINYAKIDDLDANYAHVTNGIIDNASINHANINGLESNYAHIINGTINNATIDYANVNNLENNYAHIREGIIDNAIINYASVSGLDANYAHLTDGVIDNAFIDHANVNELETYYAEIDMANVNNAWIENGVIKDGVIEDAKIAGVSANKITAGTIDAANVNVINLRADNLTVTKINGQPVIGGYTLIDSSISGYSEKNPNNEGWYEFYNNAYYQTNDTTVDSNKNYYTTSESVSLYDQNTIDNMFSNINERIDSQIETWTVDTVPLLNNEPAVRWTTDDEKDEHIGDICYVVNAASDYDGFTYRFAHDNTSDQYSWVLIQDNQVTAALGRITNLESFNNQLVHWEDATDEGVIAVRGRITELSGRIDKTVKLSTQLWYTKADTTTPAAPTSQVTNISTNGNAWTTVVPTYNSSYPYYFYCWQYQYEDNTYGWSAVIYDQATSESEERARTGIANAATAQNTANTNIKSSVQLWFTKAQIKDENGNDLYPVKPNIQVTNNSATGITSYNRWNLVVPVYNADYPYYFYCYQQQKGDNSYQWTDVVYDEATSTAMAKAQAFETFEQTTFKEVKDTVDEQTISITDLTTIIDNNGLTENTTITNTVNTVSQKANNNESKISSLTIALGTNADGTSKENDIIHQVSDINQNLDSITTRVGKTEASLKGTYATSSTAANVQNKEATIFPAITNFELYEGMAITVKFINNNTATNPKLNINSSGAKFIKTYSGVDLSEAEYTWTAGSTMTFVYDGTNWCIQDSTELTRIKSAETIIDQTANNVLIKATENDSTAAQGGQHIIQSLINVAPEGIKISADKVNIEGAAIFSGNGRLSQNSLNDTYDSKGSASAAQTAAINAAAQDATNKANAAQTAAETTAAADATSKANAAQQAAINAAAQDATNKVNAVNNQEQLIYIQAISGTLSIPNNKKPTTWITNTEESVSSDTVGLIPEWTIKRPTYRSNYPVLFVATQRQTVGGTITCSTPLKDDTLTVIDGGHITTGAIDAGRITTGTLDADRITVTNLTAENIIADHINGRPVTQAALNGNIQNNIDTISDATTSALNNLATIENVVDTLTWVTEHGTMTSTTDNTIDPTKVYFILDNNGDYTVGNNKYSIVQEPNVSNLSNYYELTIDKSVQNYIATHLSLTNEGLWLVPMATESDGCKILVATGSGTNYTEAGTYIIDRVTDSDNNTTETVVAQFTSNGISFAENRSFYIGDSNAFIHFDGRGHINIGGSQVTIGGNTTLQQLLNKYNSTITSDDISVSKSGNTATITIGNNSVNIVDGAAGEDGAQILGITTAPSSYTTTTNGFTPTYRIALSTVKTQSGASEVKIGDILAYSYYHYPVGYVDTSYVYCGVRKSIRGETGAAGHNPVITTTKNNDGSVTINVDGTPMSTVDAGEDGDTPVITTTKGSDGSVTIYIDGVLSNTVEAGANGTSYYTYIRYSANANGSNMVTTPTNATKYIGIYTGTSSSVPSYTEFEWSKYIGENGNDADPLTIISTAVDYQLSTSGTTEPTGTWSETPLAPTTTQYLWTRTTLTFSDNTTITSYSVGGKTGQDGATGGRWYAGTSITGVSTASRIFSGSGIASAVVGDMYLNTSTQNTYRCITAGAPSAARWVYVNNIKGNSVTNVEHQYYLSTSSTTAPLENDNNWKATPDPYVEGHYYWERWKIMFSAADTQYTTPTLAEEITSAWAAIEKSNEEINLRATKTEMYQTAQPNLAPIGSVDFSNIYNINTNPNGYWRTALNGINTWFTQLDDGWIHVYIDNSEGIENISNLDFSPDLCPSIIPGNPYTILTEIRNNSSLGTDENNTNFYLDEVNNNQFWGNTQNEQIDNEYTTTSTNIELLTCGQTNTLYSYRLADTSHIADINEAVVGEGIVGRAVIVDNNSTTQNNDNNNSLSSLFCYNFQCAAGSILDFDFRMSVYEGIYNGPYKPYSGPQLYSSQAELKVQADRIGMIVANDNAESNLQLTADAMTYIGDHVEIKGTDGATTAIRGGQIQTGSISVGAFDSAAQLATLNSNISVGGRNLLKFTAKPELKSTDWNRDPAIIEGWSRWSTDITVTNTNSGIKGELIADSMSGFVIPLVAENAVIGNVEYTLSFDYRTNLSSFSNICLMCASGGSPAVTAVSITPSETNWQHYEQTLKWPTTGSAVTRGLRIPYSGGPDKWVEIRNESIKLERGNKATDWSPAPEDVDSAISDAAKTATSYVTDITGNGITIHPSRSDYATNGGRAVINGDGLTVYLGSDDVASYGVSARIGKSNSDRVTVDSTNGITIYKGNNKKLQTTVNGVDIYQNNDTSVASFGSTTRIGAQNNVQVIIESDSFEIKNQLGNRFFNIEGRSSNQIVDRNPIKVCEWSDKDDVNDDLIEVTALNIIASTASNFTAPTFNIVVNDEEFELDSPSQVEFSILTNQINISLTASGIAFIQDKMTNTYNDEYTAEEGSNNTIVGTDFPCIFYVTCSRTVADKAILDFTGNQTIKGNGDLLTLSNNISNTTSTLIRVRNEQTNKSIKFGIGSNGITRGVWDETAKNWIICHDPNNKVVIQGPNFTVASTGDVKANAITMTGTLTTPILNTKNPSKAGNYRTTDGTIYTLAPFNSYDKNGASIGYSNISVSGNRIYRSFAVTNPKTNKTAALYVNNYDNGSMTLTYSSGMKLHATSVDPLSCMTAAISGQTNKSLTTSYANLTLGAVTTVGSDLTISGGGIKCTRAGKVMLSASAHFIDINDGNVCNIRLLIGSTIAAFVSHRGRTDRCSMIVPPRITTVAAGDVLYMAVANTSSATGSVDGTRTQTWMTVQYLT